MELGRLESLTLIAVIIGASVLGSATLSIGFGAAAVGDISILLALFAFDGLTTRSGTQSIAFAAVSAFCLITPLFFLANTVLGVALPSAAVTPGTSPWLVSGVWAVATLILFSVDRFRMSARDNVSLSASGLAASLAGPLVSSAPPTAYRPAPIRVEPMPSPTAYSAPAPEPIFASTSTAVSPVIPQAVTQTSSAIAPPADVLAIAPGREALIYLNLVGEGLNVLRTVRAENLGRDYYRIADVMPEGEQWEFTPGQVVKCRKKSLSNGKHMVAYEEAPRAQ